MRKLTTNTNARRKNCTKVRAHRMAWANVKKWNKDRHEAKIKMIFRLWDFVLSLSRDICLCHPHPYVAICVLHVYNTFVFIALCSLFKFNLLLLLHFKIFQYRCVYSLLIRPAYWDGVDDIEHDILISVIVCFNLNKLASKPSVQTHK